jgi:peptidyl-prolyl cis-trans isomerase SurA
MNVVALVGLLFASADAATLDRVAATVNEDVIALSEIYELGGEFIEQRCAGDMLPACRKEAELEVLDALIQRTLMKQELTELGLDVTGEDIDRGIDSMVRQYGLLDREELRREIERQGVPWDVYRDQLAEQLRQIKFTENVIRPRISVSDNEVQDLYQRTAREYAAPSEAEVEAFAISVPEGADKAAEMERMRQIVAELNEGKRDWLATVKELDFGPYKDRDGKLGRFKKGQLAPAMEGVVFSIEPGKVGPPLDLGSQILVVKVVALHQSGVRPLAEIEPQIRDQLFQQKIEEQLEQWYQQARRRAAIRILLTEGQPS